MDNHNLNPKNGYPNNILSTIQSKYFNFYIQLEHALAPILLENNLAIDYTNWVF